MQAIGHVGLTNAGRAGGVTSGDCSSCSGCQLSVQGSGFTITENPDGSMSLQSSEMPNDETDFTGYYILESLGRCCRVDSLQVISHQTGSRAPLGIRTCGTDPSIPFLDKLNLSDLVSQCVRSFYIRSSVPYKVVVTLNSCSQVLNPCRVYDFKLSPQSFERYLSGAGYYYGTWENGSGWFTSTTSSYAPALLIKKAFTTPIMVTGLNVVSMCKVTRSQSYTIDLYRNGVKVKTASISRAYTANVPDTYSFTWTAVEIDEIRTNIANKPDTNWYLQQLEVVCPA